MGAWLLRIPTANWPSWNSAKRTSPANWPPCDIMNWWEIWRGTSRHEIRQQGRRERKAIKRRKKAHKGHAKTPLRTPVSQLFYQKLCAFQLCNNFFYYFRNRVQLDTKPESPTTWIRTHGPMKPWLNNQKSAKLLFPKTKTLWKPESPFSSWPWP